MIDWTLQLACREYGYFKWAQGLGSVLLRTAFASQLNFKSAICQCYLKNALKVSWSCCLVLWIPAYFVLFLNHILLDIRLVDIQSLDWWQWMEWRHMGVEGALIFPVSF